MKTVRELTAISWSVFHIEKDGLQRVDRAPERADMFSPLALSAESICSVRPPSYFRTADFDFLTSYQELYSERLHENIPSAPQLFGYPFEIRGDMRGMCQTGLDGDSADGGSYQLSRPGFEDWQILFQVGSIGEMMWGDSGWLYFWIRQDLAERRWDRVWVMLQSF